MPQNYTILKDFKEVKNTIIDNEKQCASEAVHTGQKETETETLNVNLNK